MKIRYFAALFGVCALVSFLVIGCASQAITPAPATQPSGSTMRPAPTTQASVTPAPTTQPVSTGNSAATPQQIAAGINTWLSQNSGWITAILTALGGGVGVPLLHLILQATGIVGGKTPLSTAQLTSLATQLTGILQKVDPKDTKTYQEIQSVLNLINAALPPASTSPPPSA